MALSSNEKIKAWKWCLAYKAEHPGTVLTGDIPALLDALTADEVALVQSVLADLDAFAPGIQSGEAALKRVDEIEFFEGQISVVLSERSNLVASILQILGLFDESSSSTWAAASDRERGW